jgi:Putative zinc-finger
MTGDRGFGRGQHPEELLSASLTGDLTPAERASLDQHLSGCGQCRATLDAFAEERRLIGGLREVAPPRDLGARVRAGIEGGRLSAIPWWRRPATLVAAFASVATVAAAVLAVVVLSGIPRGPVGSTQGASPSASIAGSVAPSLDETSAPSVAPSAEPSPEPVVALQPGELGYLSLEGEPFTPSRLYFINDHNGESVEATTPTGPAVAAAISPTGEWLAYITQAGESGFNQVWLLYLRNGSTRVLGCTVPNPFTDRLSWSDDGRFLAYTLTAIDPGSIDCGGVGGDGSATDVWIFDAAATGEPARVTEAGNAFAADFTRSLSAEGQYTLLVSYAAEQPYTQPTLIPPLDGQADPEPIDGVFMPLVSPDGERALFWRGQMADDGSGAWRLAQGGMPYVSGEPVDGQPSWSGEQLFADLELPGGAGFESGRFTWGADSDGVAFWSGEWTGAPQDDAAVYPSSSAVYVGRLSEGLLTEASALELELDQELEYVAWVALSPDGASATVTVAQAAAGVGDPASAHLYEVPLDGGARREVGIGLEPPPWNGPSVYGEEASALPR